MKSENRWLMSASAGTHRRSGTDRGFFVAPFVLSLLLVLAACSPGSPPTPDPKDRIDLRVLVVSDGSETIDAITDRMSTEGVPHEVVELGDPGRAILTSDFLSDELPTGPRAKFQAVVVPNESALPPDERAALDAFESRFSIREVLAYTWANPAVGLQYAENDGYVGSLDGISADLSSGATSAGAPFAYLAGLVEFPDVEAAVSETYGYIAQPMTYLPEEAESFTPLLTATVPGTATDGVLMGVHRRDGRERLVITFDYNADQPHHALLGHGIITWVTKGLHLGSNRNFLSVHIDDVFLPDSRWSEDANCTPGDDCPLGSGVSTTDIRMESADVSVMQQWQNANGIKLDMVFNGQGSVEAIADAGADPLTDSLIAIADDLRWLNHTYSHTYLGCIQDFTIIPWECETGASGTEWESQANIVSEISDNLTWATGLGLDVPHDLLVSGEHSGLRSLPQMSVDNPNFVAALAQLGIVATASDASREHQTRQLGTTASRTVPRYPMNIFYNVGTVDEEVDEYNWIYTRVADGGSGICELFPEVTTCIDPLEVGPTGFFDYILPLEVDQAFGHVVSNDARPHYAHQSNLAEDRILYPVLDGVLNRYELSFATNAPVLNPTYRESHEEIIRQAEWRAALDGGASGYLLDGRVYVENAPAFYADVPLTVPDGPTSSHDYGGEESGWIGDFDVSRSVSAPWS